MTLWEFDHIHNILYYPVARGRSPPPCLIRVWRQALVLKTCHPWNMLSCLDETLLFKTWQIWKTESWEENHVLLCCNRKYQDGTPMFETNYLMCLDGVELARIGCHGWCWRGAFEMRLRCVWDPRCAWPNLRCLKKVALLVWGALWRFRANPVSCCMGLARP